MKVDVLPYWSTLETYQASRSHYAHNEWVFESGCTHHMDKHAFLFTSLNKVEERKIYVIDDFSLNISGHGDVFYRHGRIYDIYHVPNISFNMLYVSQLTKRSQIMEFWPYWFFVKNLKVNLFSLKGFSTQRVYHIDFVTSLELKVR
jgi:hypothetical protein